MSIATTCHHARVGDFEEVLLRRSPLRGAGAGTGNGAIDSVPLASNCAAEYLEQSAIDLLLSTDIGWHVDAVSGCDGELSGSICSTGAITDDCEVAVSFMLLQPTIFADSFE